MRTLRLAVLLLLIPFAAELNPAAAKPSPCWADAQRFCGGPVDSYLAGCFVSHLADLSPQCQHKVTNAMKKAAGLPVEHNHRDAGFGAK